MKSFNKIYQTIIEARLLTVDKPKYGKLTFNNFRRSPDKVYEGIRYYSREKIIPAIQRTLRMGRPVFIAGEPGVAKSHTVRQLAAQRAASMGRKLVIWNTSDVEYLLHLYSDEGAEERSKIYLLLDIRTNTMEREDFIGMPNIFTKRPYTEYKPQDWLYYTTLKNSAGMIFLDEVNQGSVPVLKALMQFFLDKCIGKHHLNTINGHWDIASAGNTRAVDSNEVLPPALLQRATPFGMTITTREWVNYAKSVNIPDDIISFVAAGYTKEADGTESNERLTTTEVVDNQNSPSPRSLEEFGKFYKDIMDDKEMPIDEKENELRQHAEGLLGYKWSDDFMIYLEMSHKFDFKEYIEDADLFANDPAKYVAKYKLSKSGVAQIKKEAELAAEHIQTKYFKHGDNVQLGIMLQLAQELVDICSDELKGMTKITKESVKGLSDSAKQAIKQFVGFVKLMDDTNNKEINAIMVAMFVDNPTSYKTLLTILTALTSDTALQVYKALFEKTFKSSLKLQKGIYEDEESSTKPSQVMSPDNWKKLMQIKHKVDMIAGLQSV